MMSGLQIAVLGWLFLSLLLTIGMVGKPRKPTTPGVAVIATLMIAVMALATVLFGGC